MEMDEDLAAVRDSDATVWLEPPPELVTSAKSVAEKFFGAAVRYVPKNPLKRLLTQGFDAEQIWQQIEIQDQSLLAAVRRQLKHVERASDADLFGVGKAPEKSKNAGEEELDEGREEEDEDEEEAGDEEESGEDEEDGDVEEEEEAGVLEDKFLKMKDMESFLDDAEAKYARRDEEGGDDDEDDEMDDAGSLDEDGSEDDIRYDDFFVKQKQKQKKGPVTKEEPEKEEPDEENEEDEESEEEGEEEENEEKLEGEDGDDDEQLVKSTYEKQAEKTRKRIELLEKANMDPKHWTMLGEVTAKKRPKNSALEVDLDFEHNLRPAPVITEEVTASIEDIIRRRIIDGQFDDVKRKEKLPEMPPAEKKEIDESKSTKGLGELYEADYMQSAGLADAPKTEAEQLKKEATILFKTLCTKLDALSHFHFAPKPVIEDMEVKQNVPALAMEEVAPVFVSEASMLAPEEMFSGKGLVKDEKELSQSERKSRRASKKRKFKGKQNASEQKKKPRTGEASAPAAAPKKTKSAFVKSGKMFAELDRQKHEGPVKPSDKKKTGESAASFKL